MATKNGEMDQIIKGFMTSLSEIIEREVQGRLNTAVSSLGTSGLKVKAGRKKADKKNIKPCRVEGCKEPSTGPRFHFLCAEHRKNAKLVKEHTVARKKAA